MSPKIPVNNLMLEDCRNNISYACLHVWFLNYYAMVNARYVIHNIIYILFESLTTLAQNEMYVCYLFVFFSENCELSCFFHDYFDAKTCQNRTSKVSFAKCRPIYSKDLCAFNLVAKVGT